MSITHITPHDDERLAALADLVVSSGQDPSAIAVASPGAVRWAQDFFAAQEDEQSVWDEAITAAKVRAGLPEDADLIFRGIGMAVEGGVILSGPSGVEFVPEGGFAAGEDVTLYDGNIAEAA